MVKTTRGRRSPSQTGPLKPGRLKKCRGKKKCIIFTKLGGLQRVITVLKAKQEGVFGPEENEGSRDNRTVP